MGRGTRPGLPALLESRCPLRRPQPPTPTSRQRVSPLVLPAALRGPCAWRTGSRRRERAPKRRLASGWGDGSCRFRPSRLGRVGPKRAAHAPGGHQGAPLAAALPVFPMHLTWPFISTVCNYFQVHDVPISPRLGLPLSQPRPVGQEASGPGSEDPTAGGTAPSAGARRHLLCNWNGSSWDARIAGQLNAGRCDYD